MLSGGWNSDLVPGIFPKINMGKIAENDKPIPGQGSHSAKPVIFLHIPKTAGTTLHDIIERHYVPGEICTFGADAHAAVEDFKTL